MRTLTSEQIKERYRNLAIRGIAEQLKISASDLAALLYLTADESPLKNALQIAVGDRIVRLMVDDVLVTNWITVKDDDYRKALNDLISFNMDLERYEQSLDMKAEG